MALVGHFAQIAFVGHLTEIGLLDFGHLADKKFVSAKKFNTKIMATASLLGCEADTHLTQGTPQGGVLSPVVWNLGFDSLLAAFDGDPAMAFGFADDLALVVTGADPASLVAAMQKAIIIAEKWGAING